MDQVELSPEHCRNSVDLFVLQRTQMITEYQARDLVNDVFDKGDGHIRVYSSGMIESVVHIGSMEYSAIWSVAKYNIVLVGEVVDCRGFSHIYATAKDARTEGLQLIKEGRVIVTEPTLTEREARWLAKYSTVDYYIHTNREDLY